MSLSIEENTVMKSKIVSLSYYVPEENSEDTAGVEYPNGTVLAVRLCNSTGTTRDERVTTLYYVLGDFTITEDDVVVQEEDETYFNNQIIAEVLIKIPNFNDLSDYESTSDEIYFIDGVINVLPAIISKYDNLLGL